MTSSISYTIIDYTATRRLALFLNANTEKERTLSVIGLDARGLVALGPR